MEEERRERGDTGGLNRGVRPEIENITPKC